MPWEIGQGLLMGQKLERIVGFLVLSVGLLVSVQTVVIRRLYTTLRVVVQVRLRRRVFPLRYLRFLDQVLPEFLLLVGQRVLLPRR